MKKTLLKLLAIVLLIGFATPAFAQGDSDDGTANAEIVTAMTLTAVDTLEFGDIVSPTGSSCTVIIAADGSPSGTCTSGGTQQEASFDVTGDASENYTITLPGAPINMIGPGGIGVDEIPVDTFVHSYGAGQPALGVGGTDTFTVGATATVGDGEAGGSYTGDFTVSVDYGDIN